MESATESGRTILLPSNQTGEVLEEEEELTAESEEGKGEASENLVQELDGEFEIVSTFDSLTPTESTPCQSNLFLDEPIETKNERLVKLEEPTAQDTDFEKCSYNTKLQFLRKYLKDVKLQEQRELAMDDSKEGLVPSKGEDDSVVEDDATSESDWMDLGIEREEEARNVEENVFVNVGVLWAIVDFVFN